MRRAALLWTLIVLGLAAGDASATRSSQPPVMSSACSDTSPCPLHAGTYRLGPATVLPGLQFTLPSGGWSSAENSGGELKVIPPGHPEEWLFVWMDLVAV